MFNKILLCLALSGSALAEPNNLSWNAPTERVDGTVLAPTEIVEYEIRHGSSPVDLKYKTVLKTKELKAQIVVTKPDKYCYQIRTIADVPSDWSKEVCKTVYTSKPKSITLVIK
jgi:hypothetical protein